MKGWEKSTVVTMRSNEPSTVPASSNRPESTLGPSFPKPTTSFPNSLTFSLRRASSVGGTPVWTFRLGNELWARRRKADSRVWFGTGVGVMKVRVE